MPLPPPLLKTKDYWKVYKNPVGCAAQPFNSFSRPDLSSITAPVRRVRRKQGRNFTKGGGTVTDYVNIESEEE
jgi:hypothetical protein